MKVFNYLYYKLYQAFLKSSMHDIPEFLAPVGLGGLLSSNILVVSAFLAKLDILPFLFSNKGQAGGFSILLVILTMLYYRKKRYIKILKKYSQESKKQKLKGNMVTIIYVILSFLSIFAVALFKPGEL